MKRILTPVLIVVGLTTYAQETKFITVTSDNKSEVIRDLATSQADDAAFMAMSGEVQGGATMTTYIYGDDKYLKTKADDKRYNEFEIYETKGKDKEDVMVGLITGSLDRRLRYNELGAKEDKLEITQTGIEILNIPAENLTTGLKEKIAGFRNTDKYFVIMGEGDYRYIDGKAIVGDKLMVEEMRKGKPITAITFFYELQKAGIADEEMTVKEFLSLSVNQQQEIVNDGFLALN
jgi:hypothetical protein